MIDLTVRYAHPFAVVDCLLPNNTTDSLSFSKAQYTCKQILFFVIKRTLNIITLHVLGVMVLVYVSMSLVGMFLKVC